MLDKVRLIEERYEELNRLMAQPEVATDPVGPDETEVNVQLKPKEQWTSARDLDELGEKMKQARVPVKGVEEQ